MLSSSSTILEFDSRDDPQFCAFCGKERCRRVFNPLDLPFSYCHHCGRRMVCSLRPTVDAAAQTPREWSAFSSRSVQDDMLSQALEEFAAKASQALKTADARDDVQQEFSSSPMSARAKVAELLRTHEEALLHIRRVHEAEVRALKNRVSMAEQRQVDVREALDRAKQELLVAEHKLLAQQDREAERRASAVEEARRQWQAVAASEEAARSMRDGELVAAWKVLYHSVLRADAVSS